MIKARCEYCKEDWMDRKYLENNEGESIGLFVTTHNELRVTCDCGNTVYAKIKYCPICGREL